MPALFLDKRAILVPDFALCELLIKKKKVGWSLQLVKSFLYQLRRT